MEKFVEKIREIQEEAKAALGKAQEDMKKYIDCQRRNFGGTEVEDNR